MFRRTVVPAVILALAATLPALAGNGDPTDHTTTWVKPASVRVPGNCVWRATIRPARRDDRKHDPSDTGWTSWGGIADAYAHTIADGQQIWGYAWARDNTFEPAPAAAVSSSSSGNVRVFATTVPEGCVAYMRVDWNPRFRLRMLSEDSSPVRTPSAMPRATYYHWLGSREEKRNATSASCP